VAEILVENERPRNELMFIPALVLLGLVILLQRRRRARQATVAA
jgi:MYXO-CTERM domain-containing protein